MKIILIENLIVFSGYILSNGGVIPQFLSPLFSLSVYLRTSLRENYFFSLTSVFFLGLANDLFTGFPLGATSILFILFHPFSRLLLPFVHFENPFILFFTGLFFSFFILLGYLIMPGINFPGSAIEMLRVGLLSGLWTPIMFFILQRTERLLGTGK